MAKSIVEWQFGFRNNLRKVMEGMGMTQDQLANEIGVTQATISRYMSGEILPNAYILAKIASATFADYNNILPYLD